MAHPPNCHPPTWFRDETVDAKMHANHATPLATQKSTRISDSTELRTDSSRSAQGRARFIGSRD